MIQTGKKLSGTGELLRTLTMAICDKKEQVKVLETNMTRVDIFTVQVADDDFGKIMGTHAKNLLAMEAVIKVIAAREGREARISAVDPQNKIPPPSKKFRGEPSWDRTKFLPYYRAVCDKLFDGGGTFNVVDIGPVESTVEINVNAENELFVYDGPDKRPVSFDAIEVALRTLFNAIGKCNGRTLTTYVIAVNYPVAYGKVL